MKPLSLQKVISSEQRRQILAMAARGDTNVAIAQVTGVDKTTVARIKNRNTELLADMKDTINTYRAQKATDILDKSENLIIRKLNKALDDPKQDRITIDELSRLAKTAYERVRLETGKATSISATDTLKSPQGSQMDLEALVEAIKSGDEVKLQQMVFNAKDNKDNA